jgi:hypothetical protein
MTSHQETLEDLCLELMNAWAVVHDDVKSLRVALHHLSGQAGAAESTVDQEMQRLIRLVNEMRDQLEDQVLPDPMASDR